MVAFRVLTKASEKILLVTRLQWEAVSHSSQYYIYFEHFKSNHWHRECDLLLW